MIRGRHLSFTSEPLDTAHVGSTNKIPRIRFDPHSQMCEAQMKDDTLDERPLIDAYRRDDYMNHSLNRGNLCDEMGQKTVIESKGGYLNQGIKQRSLCKDVGQRTMMQDKNGYEFHGVRRGSQCQDVDWRTVVDSKDDGGIEFWKENRVLSDSVGGGDPRAKFVSGNLRQDNFKGGLNKALSSESLHVHARDLGLDYDEGFHPKSLHAQASKSTQGHQISVKRLERGSVFHKKWMNSQGFANDYDSIGNCESYNSYKQSSDELNNCYAEATPDIDSGNELAGLIFMCNNKLRKSCFRHGVFGMPLSKVKLLDHVKPGTKLFLFEYESRQLWGIYQAISYPGRELENEAFRGSEIDFPLQVRFSVYKSCEPLPERQFKQAINENYFCVSKFKFDLNTEQVSRLIRLFCSRDILSKHVSKSLPQTSLSKDSLHDWSSQEPRRLIKPRFGKDSFWEEDIVAHTRDELLTENIKNSSNFQQSSVSGVFKPDQNYHGSGKLSQDLDLEDDIAGRMDMIGFSRLNDLHLGDRDYMMKEDSSEFNKAWANHKRIFKGEEVMNDNCCKDANANHARNGQCSGWGSHICDNILDGCQSIMYSDLERKDSSGGKFMYSDLEGKDSSGRKCNIVKPFSIKGSVPTKGRRQQRDGRLVNLLKHEMSHRKVAVPFANLANPEKKGQSLKNSSRLHMGQVDARYNVQIASKDETEQSDDCREEYENIASIHGHIGLKAPLARSVLNTAYLEAHRTNNDRQNLLVSNNEEINPILTPNHESRKGWEAGFSDGMRGMATATRNLTTVGNKNIGLTSSKVLDDSESVRLALENDTAWMDALQDAGGRHIIDGDEGVHLQSNKFGPIQNLISPFVGMSRAFPKNVMKISNSRQSTRNEQSPSRAKSPERILQKKPTVWDRLSGRVSTTYNPIKTRSMHMEEMNQGDENASEGDESYNPVKECYSPSEVDDTEVNDAEDASREDFFIDFKRRKTIRGSQDQTEETTVMEASKSNIAPQEESMLQNNSNVHKKRRRLIRPEIACSGAKTVQSGNHMQDKEQHTLMSSENKNSADAVNSNPKEGRIQPNADTQALEPSKVPCV